MPPTSALASVDTLHPGLPVPGVLGLPLRWVADGPLAGTLLQVLAANSPSAAGGPPAGQPTRYLAFALALSSRAGIHETTRLTADLDRPLTDGLRGLTAAQSRRERRPGRLAPGHGAQPPDRRLRADVQHAPAPRPA